MIEPWEEWADDDLPDGTEGEDLDISFRGILSYIVGFGLMVLAYYG